MRKILSIITVLFIAFNLSGQAPDTTCVDCDVFCFLEDLEGIWTLPEPWEPELPDRICDNTDGQPNNMLYFCFVPNSATVSLQLTAITCTPTNSTNIGFQWGILDGCDLEDPTYVICDGDQQTGTVTVTYDQFIPGNTYVLYLDGYEGAICDIQIDVLTGIPSIANPYEVEEITYFSNAVDSYIAVGDTIEFCYNGTLVTTAHGSDNNDGYIWSSPDPETGSDIIHPTNLDSIAFQFTETDSLYKLCTYATTDCDESEEVCFYVNITSIPTDSLGTFEYCSADLTTGVIPDGWLGDELTSPGPYTFTIVDTITGCTQEQKVRINENAISIESFDTLICGIDTLFYNGDTITGDYFEAQYRFDAGSVNGCDSLLNFTAQRVRFYASLSELSCLDNEQFGIELLLDSIIPANYEQIIVDWFKDDVHYLTGMPNELSLEVSEKGTYSALVSVFVDGVPCTFDLNEIEIDRFITAGYGLSSDAICVDDTLTVTLDAFNIAATYEWLSGDEIIELFPGVYQIRWDQPGVYNLGLKVDFDGCEVTSEFDEITVEASLEKPLISCAGSTNDSITIEWDLVDCASEYEIWLEGALILTSNIPKYSFSGLNEGQSYEISVIALSDCLCPSVADTVMCATENCPDDVDVFIDQLPLSICFDELEGDTTLTGYVTGSSGGTLTWTGTIITAEGLIEQSNLSPGEYPITLNYTLDQCSYEITDTFFLYGPVDMDVQIEDISCYYNSDGSISTTAIQGSTPFTLFIDGHEQLAMDTFNLSEGIYDLTLTDANNCSVSGTYEVLKPEAPVLTIYGDTFIERGQTYEYELTLDDIDYDSVVWYVPALDSILCAGTCDEISYAPEFDQDLCIELFFDDVCKLDTCIHLIVNLDVKVYVPNIFTPGKKDGLNDYFMIKTNAYKDLKLVNFSIFDRWGEMVFFKGNQMISRNTDESFGWDGTLNGQDLSTGVYIYYIEIEEEDGIISRYYGDITLFR